MRFHHEDFAPLERYLAVELCDIRRFEWDLHPVEAGSFAFLPWTVKRRPAHVPVPATVSEIRECFHRADKPELAGTVLLNYFHINAPAGDQPVSLNGAVEHVEAYGGPKEFLLVGYADGGLISVSRCALPFQDGVPRADWWGPR